MGPDRDGGFQGEGKERRIRFVYIRVMTGYTFVYAVCKMQIYFRQFANMKMCARVIGNIWQNFAV
jgi:hypothetical protein